jgi:hypothetical protein
MNNVQKHNIRIVLTLLETFIFYPSVTLLTYLRVYNNISTKEIKLTISTENYDWDEQTELLHQNMKSGKFLCFIM